MRNIKIAMIAVLCVIMLGLCVLLSFSISGRGFWNRQDADSYASYQQIAEEEISPEGLHTIDIDFSSNSNDVRVYEGDGDKIVIKEYANYDVPDSEATAIKVNGGTLEIKGKRRRFAGFQLFYFGNGDGYTEVYLPKAYVGNLKICTASGDAEVCFDLQLEGNLDVTVASGDVTMKNVTAQKADFTSASGDIRLEGLEAEQASITTASGDVHLMKSEADDISVNTASGDVYLLKPEADDISVNTASGDVQIQEVRGRFDCTTASGDVKVEEGSGQGEIGTASGEVRISLAELTGDLSVSTASGDVTIALPTNSSFTFEADTASGDIDTFFDEMLQFSKKGDHASGAVNGDNAGRRVDIETASGEIRVRQY